jgi:hypothetical protein
VDQQSKSGGNEQWGRKKESVMGKWMRQWVQSVGAKWKVMMERLGQKMETDYDQECEIV